MIGLWLVSAIALLVLIPTASAATVAEPSQSAEVQPSVHAEAVPTSTSNDTSSNEAVVPDANTVINVYNEIGYNGNGSIYPTSDGQIQWLPPVNASRVWQTAANNSQGVPNGIQLSIAGKEPNKLEQSFYYFSPAGYFLVQVTFASASGSQQFTEVQTDNGPTQYWTAYQEFSETVSGLPTCNACASVSLQGGIDSGDNITFTSQGSGSAGMSLNDALSLALDGAAFFIPNEVSVPFDVLVLLKDVLNVGSYSDSQHPYQAGIPSVDGTMVQFGQVDNGAWGCVGFGSGCGYPAGSNAMSRVSQVQLEIQQVSNVSSGALTIQGKNEVGVCQTSYYGCSGPYSGYAGASQELSIPTVPAVSVGGYVDLWPNGPVLPQATVVTQQQYDNQTWFQSNYETTSSSGYYHVFLDPNVWYTQQQAIFQDALGRTTSSPASLPIGGYGQYKSEGLNMSQVNPSLDGGQVLGYVSGPIGGVEQRLSGATVKLCNNQGCISTTSSNVGAYSLNFPVAGTASDPYSMTVSGGGLSNAFTYTGLQLPVGQYTHENLALYAVTFTENGLSNGVGWSVTLNGFEQGSTAGGSPITFLEPNESSPGYSFTVTPITGETETPSSGHIIVNGQNVGQTVVFAPNAYYTVTFTENGLPSGTQWSVTLGSTTHYSTGTTIAFGGLADGYYDWSAPAQGNYAPQPSGSQVTVNGANVGVSITFTASGHGGGCVALGTPILTPSGYVSVQKLKSGQAIEEYNFSSMRLVQATFLSGNTTNVTQLIDINNGWLYVTPTEQPIYIENATFTGWLHDPQNLTTSDRIFDPVTQTWIHVSSVKLIADHTVVFDVVTSGANNFVANGALLDIKIG